MLYYIALRYFGQTWKSYRSFFNLNAKGYMTFVSIYCHFSISIMSTKPYLYLICEKKVKSKSELIRHFHVYNGCLYLIPPYKSVQHKSHNKKMP